MVCSNCAARRPSAAKVVQLSSHVMHSVLPSVRIGSAVKDAKKTDGKVHMPDSTSAVKGYVNDV